MIQQIDKIELADGTTLEIKFKDRWFENSEIKKAFKNTVVATRVDKTKSVLRFFFVHPSYFRAFEEFGLPLLFMPIVSNYKKYQAQVAEVIQLSKETANAEFSEFGKKIAPIILEVFVKPLSHWLEEAKESAEKSEEEIEKAFILQLVEKMGETTTDKDVIKKIIRKHISPEIFSHALGLGKTTFKIFSNTLAEKGLERYKLLAQEISENDIRLCEKTTNVILEQNMVTPLITIAVCMNKYCKHTELTISNRIPEAKCGKCEGDTLSTTFTFINEPYLRLKDKMLDLHAFLYSYIESKSTQEHIDGKLKSSLECFLNAYINNAADSKNQREVDALIYSITTKKATAIEIKIHQIRSQLPHERLQNILQKDLAQLVETLKQINLKTGCYITNLKISDEEIQDIKENLIPKITADSNIKNIEIISFTNEKAFLSKLDKLINNIKSEGD